MHSRSDLVAEALAGACAAVVTALVLDREPVKRAADHVPRLGWNPHDGEDPPILARLLAGAVATVIFRSTFGLTKAAAQKLL